MQKIIPSLWFDNQAEEAAKFYISIFPNSQIINTVNYDSASSKAANKPEGSIMIVNFKLNNFEFVALNGGPEFKFSEAISFIVNCDTQEEIDNYWEKLIEGGEPSVCGWLKDKFGLSWQIVPSNLSDLVKNPKAMEAMLQMNKIDINTLKQASEQM